MKCRVCDSENLNLAIDLGKHPWANDFLKKEDVGKEVVYPLEVYHCSDCETAQLGYTIKKEIMFGDHTYLSGMTKTLDNHFKKMAEEVDSRFFSSKENKSVLDIGSNDGTQLKHYQALGYDVLGIESSRSIAKMANDNGITTDNSFFNLDIAKKHNKKFDVINASGVFFHLEELHSVADGIKYSLDDDGVFAVQALYMKNIIENKAFDQIYHEHLLYYTVKTLDTLLNRHDMELFDARIDPIHGGSIIGFATHKGTKSRSERLKSLIKEENAFGANDLETYKRFESELEQKKQENLNFLRKCKNEGKKVFGLGAPVKGNTLLNYFGVGTDLIECLTEKNPMRDGLFSPGMHIPVVMEDGLKENPDVYYVLAWNFKDEILKRNKNLIDEGVEFFFPVDVKK